MNTVIKNKVDKLFNKLNKINYLNPFINSTILSYAKKLNIRLIPESMGYNGISSLGFLDNKLCEIIVERELSEEQILHLNNLTKLWDFQPYLVLINSLNGKITSIDKYTKYNIKIKTPDNSWVAASHTRNYMLDDPIIDYLKFNNLDNVKKSNKRKRSNSETFLEHIFDSGNQFEENIIFQIKSMIKKEEFIEIGKSYECTDIKKYLKTLDAIKNNIPVIYQAVLWNSSNKTFGSADLIIKSSFASKIFPSYISDSSNDKYEVYDIKWSNLRLKSDEDELINEISIKPYKAQLWIYTEALNKVQINKSSRCFLIGKNYYREKTINKKLIVTNYSNPFEKLGIVDFNNEYLNIEKTIQAINWIKEVKINKKLRIDPPNDSRLYPNMKNTKDSNFYSIKKKLAEKNKEITLIFSVGKKRRDLALQNNITKYNDSNLSSKILGFSENSKIGKTIDNILDINRLETKLNNRNYWPTREEKLIGFNQITNLGNWKNTTIKCYVDIETISTKMYNLDSNKNNIIFMIGLGVVKNNKWSFYVFTANNLNSIEEDRIIKEFEDKLIEIENELLVEEKIPIYSWSNYENLNLKPFIKINKSYQFYDMCRWFSECEISIKDALDFKLKNINKALYNNGLTTITWNDNINGGLDAMNLAYNYYTSTSAKNPLKEIEYYNEIDCRSMSEIHNILNNI